MAVETKEWIELAKLSQDSFQNRRAVEWKLAFGFWIAIGSFTAAFFTLEGFSCPAWLPWVLGIAYVLVLLVVIFCWQIPLHSAHAGDREWFIFYMDRAWWDSASGTAQPAPPVKGQPPKWNRNNRSWCIGQCAFTAFFLVLSWVAITQVASMKAARGDKPVEATGKAG
ncbi:MAG: hypothetical protein K2V38_25250 [Gemmataceae bacterium]|nr:hypothetical protein [Gemmataceae bacterium]